MFLGLSEEFVGGSCPKDLKPYMEMRRLQLKEQNEAMWLQGRYVYEALGATVGNMFKSRGSTPNQYPKEPYALYGEKQNSDPEANEKLAVAEMEAYISFLKHNGKIEDGE